MNNKLKQTVYMIGTTLMLMSPHIAYLVYNSSELWTICFSAFFSFCLASLVTAINKRGVRLALFTLFFVVACFEFTTILAYRNYLNPCDISAFFTFNSLESSSLILYIIRLKLMPYLCIFLLFLGLCVLTFHTDAIQCKKAWLYACASLLLAGGVIAFKISNPFAPYNIIKESYTALQNNWKRHSLTKQDPVHYSIICNYAPKGIYVLALGESLRYENMGINGKYARNTTPQLEQTENILLYSDYYSTATFTQLAIPLLFTDAAANSFKNCYTNPTIHSIYKQAGYKTYIISHQGQIMRYVGHQYSLRGADSVLYVSHDRDIPKTLQQITSKDDAAFIILHFQGNHFLYSNYPECYNEWKPNYTYNPNEHNDSIFINAYDNSILYTDSLLTDCINKLDSQNITSVFMFASDHGEYIDSNSGGHGFSYHPTKDEYHVPLMVWVSDEYKEAYPEKVANAFMHKDEPVCADHVFWSVLDMAGIQIDSTIQQEGMSIFGDTLLPHERTLLLPDGKSVMDLD